MKKVIDTHYSKKNALEPGVIQFAEKNMFHGYQDVMQSINKMQTNLLPAGGIFEATSIPYTRSLYGDILQNPTTLAINASQEMAYSDSVIKSTLKYRQIMITSRIGRYRHKNSDIEHTINYMFNNFRMGKTKFFDGLMTCDWAGFSANYLSWRTYKGKYIIHDVIWMPPTSIIMSVNQDGRLKDFGGVMQYYYNTNLNGWANGFTYGGAFDNSSPNVPRGDFPIPLRIPYINPMYLKPFHLNDILLHTFNGTTNANNPYGDMATRAIWQNYTEKQGTLQNLMIATNFKAAPMVVFYTDSTRPVQLSNGETITIADDVVRAINDYNGNGVIVFKGKKGETVEHAVIDNTADLSKIIEVLNYQDNQMRFGLFSSDTAMKSEGNFATAASHSSMFSKYIEYATECTCETILTQMVKKVINYNWKGEEDLGYFEIVEQSIDDKLKLAKLIEFGEKYNILCRDPSEKEQSLADLNMARECMGWSTVKDLWENPPLEEDKVNVGEANRAAGQPHADGVANYAKRYSKS